MVPFAAGGGDCADAEPLGRELGQTIIVENRPGAGGISARPSPRAPIPRGYTLAYGTNGTQATNHWLYKSPGYAPGDFEPVSRFTIIAAALVVNSADERFKTLEQLIACAKPRPGELTCGSAGNGTSSHLACELLNQMAGIKVMHIPYKGRRRGHDRPAGRPHLVHDRRDAQRLGPDRRRQAARALGVTTRRNGWRQSGHSHRQRGGREGLRVLRLGRPVRARGTPVAGAGQAQRRPQPGAAEARVRKMLESRAPFRRRPRGPA